MFNPYFIAEIGVNHEADINLAKKIIKDAKSAGADAIKLQCYKAELIASKFAKSYWDKKENKEISQFKLFKKYDKFGEKEYLKIYKFCKKINIDFIITPFDLETIKFFKNKVKYFKISSSDITNFPLIERVARANKPIILSSGASNFSEVEKAVNFIKKFNNKITVLQCILNYPTKRYDVNLGMMDQLKKLNLPIGISDHTKPKDSFDVLLIGTIKGAKIIEKHFTHNKKKKGNDHFHSFDKRDLVKFKEKIKDLNKIIGMSQKKFIKSESKSRKNARRSLFFNKNLSNNHKIKKEDLVSLRPALGISPIYYKKFIGQKLTRSVKSGDIVKNIHFKNLKLN